MPKIQKNKKTRSPSDWIVFLQGQITSELNIMLAFIASLVLVFLTLTQLSIITGDMSFIGIKGQFPSITSLAIQWGFILIVFLVFIIMLINPKTKLCKKIIKGELTNHYDILRYYEDKVEPNLNFLKKLKRK